jgi:hypothetical protein
MHSEKTDNAVGIAYRGDLRIRDDYGGVGVPHRERRAALDAGRAVAQNPIELGTQLADHVRDPLFGEGILVSGLRSREDP